jgi:uncharacterized membrane protein YhfC
MNILYVTYILDFLFLLAAPIVLGVVLVRKMELEGRWWWMGAAIFVLSQIGLLPFENYVVNPALNNLSLSGKLPSLAILIIGALALGLSAALFEELFRYGMFRWWAKDARSWGSGLLTGAGHGGAAAIILGFLVVYNFINMSMVKNIDPSTLVTANLVPGFQDQITAFWSAPWYYSLREAFQQLFTIPIQLCLAVLVLQTFVRKQWYWVFLAIGFHTLVETSKIMAQNLIDENLISLVLAVFAIASVAIIVVLRRSDPAPVFEPSKLSLAAASYRMGAEPKSVEEAIKSLKDQDR